MLLPLPLASPLIPGPLKMLTRVLVPTVLFLLLLLTSTYAWDQDQMEIFDVVEEVNENFYALLGVDEKAETSEIKKAYRKLSLQLHPDRNPAEDAEVKFRQLVAVYEILKNAEKRGQYDAILRDGLPDWRQPVFYYRKARKLGLLEMCVILFVISTVGHYLVIWAMYLEKKFELEEVLFSQMKRKHEKEMKRKRERNVGAGLDRLAEGVSEMVTDMLEAPTLYRLLPVQLGFALKDIVVSAPENYRQVMEMVKEALREMRERRATVQEEEGEEEEEEEETKEKKPKPKRKRIVLPEYSESEVYQRKPESAENAADSARAAANASPDTLPPRAHQPWTEDDLSKLSKAMARFPVGTLNRWEKVAEFSERTVNEIMQKNKEIRDSQFHRMNQAVSVDSPEEKVKKNKKSAQAMAALSNDVTRREETDGVVESSASSPHQQQQSALVKEELSAEDGGWSQNQQKIFEWALAQYPKGTAERWDKIAEHIPGKTKADCVARFKFIVEQLKQKKSAAA